MQAYPPQAPAQVLQGRYDGNFFPASVSAVYERHFKQLDERNKYLEKQHLELEAENRSLLARASSAETAKELLRRETEKWAEELRDLKRLVRDLTVEARVSRQGSGRDRNLYALATLAPRPRRTPRPARPAPHTPSLTPHAWFRPCDRRDDAWEQDGSYNCDEPSGRLHHRWS